VGAAAVEGRAFEDGPLWAAVDALVRRAPTLADLRSHRLELFEARRLRALGAEVPPPLLALERSAAVGALAAPVLLERIREAYSGAAIVFKGPEVARLYPSPVLRPYSDLDLLVDEPEAAQAALLAAGFEEVGDPDDYVDIHHLRPLSLPELPLVVELHTRPKWVPGLRPPPVAELFAAALPAGGGLLRLPPAHHALLLAAHSWAHEPLRRLGDVVDVAAVAGEARPEEIESLAAAWGASRLWGATRRAVDAVLGNAPPSRPLRLWGQNLAQVRERTVLENHLQRWLSDFSVLPPASAGARLPGVLASELLPERAESWAEKLVRAGRAVRNASRPRSEHHHELERRRRR
jgi:hypothetical protein